jgi:hypothetical protein
MVGIVLVSEAILDNFLILIKCQRLNWNKYLYLNLRKKQLKTLV